MSGDSDKFDERIAGGKGDATVIVPAATVILLRDTAKGPETLMLRKNSKIAFGGMWVFPGGRVDDDDAPGKSDEERARVAAVREAAEEADLSVASETLVWFSHWTPPPVEIRRYSTWFFAARAPDAEVAIDDGEITDSQWMRPSDALAKHRAQEIQLVPPTYVTLHYLAEHESVDAALRGLVPAGGPRHYVTQIAKADGGMAVMWDGDAGYATLDASVAGPRHRLTMTKQGFLFEDSGLG
ncbi:MAG: NUDIX domain-containing protein [Candidatus Binatia bacterium]|nr:NUDIX domain-containing protein [Candidatus Binatia bacterium]